MNKSNQPYSPTALAAPAQPPVVETAAMVLAAQAKALVEARYVIAIKQPRDMDVVRSNFLRECKRQSFAEVALYSKPVGQERIEGPSIRFAEAILQSMGNISIQTPVVYDDGEKRIMRVTVMDLERNVTAEGDVTIRKVVERRSLRDGEVAISVRENSRGQKTYLRAATDEEMLNTVNALVSKAIRTLGLRLVPGWLIDEALREVASTLQANAKSNPDAEKNKLLDAFSGIGVTPAMVKAYLGHNAERLQPVELKTLRSIYSAIRDEETTWADVMAQRKEELEADGEKQTKADEKKEAEARAPEKKAVEAAKQIVEQVADQTQADDHIGHDYPVTDASTGETHTANTAKPPPPAVTQRETPTSPARQKSATDSVKQRLQKLRESTTGTLPGTDTGK